MLLQGRENSMHIDETIGYRVQFYVGGPVFIISLADA